MNRIYRRCVQNLIIASFVVLSACSNPTEPLKNVLEAVTGPIPDSSFSSKEWDFNDQRLQDLRDIMRVFRRKSQTPFKGTGKIIITFQEGQATMDGGSLIVTPYLKMASGERRELVVSRWETVLLNIESENGWRPILPLGDYNVIGTEKNSVIEVEHLELKTSMSDTESFGLPVVNYLPSTFEQMEALTWIGKNIQ